MRAKAFAVAIGLFVGSGCGRYLWTKPGATQAEFYRSVAYCNDVAGNPELFQTTNATPVQKDMVWRGWRACMNGNGWTYTRVE